MTNQDVRVAKAEDGTSLYYESVGDAEPLVFLHGSYTSRYAWSRQREALAPHFRLILRDLRGHDGAPSVAPPGYGFDTTEVADMLAVLDADGVERAHLVGHSTGAAIALTFALQHPERVRNVVLCEPTLVSFMTDEMFEPVLTDDSSVDDETRVATAMVAILGEEWRSRVSERALARMLAQSPINRAHTEVFRRRRHIDEGVAALRAPALFVYGENGVWPADVRDGLRRRFGVEICTIAGAGHNIHIDRPEAFNAAVLGFLKGQG